MTDKNLQALRREMKRHRVDVYVMMVSDFHSSEYVGDYFKEISFLTGFTGENSYTLITQDEAYLWADGRYFLQAEREIEGSGFKMLRMGVEDDPKIEDKLKETLNKGKMLGLDGRLISYETYKNYNKIVKSKEAKIKTDINLIDALWKDRPALSAEPVWILAPKYAGKTVKRKLRDVLDHIKEEEADGFLLASLCDIAWLLNLRGNDIASCPVFLSYMWITPKKAVLYIQKKALNDKIKAYLKKNQITIKPYEAIYQDLTKEKASRILLDPNVVNAALIESLPKKAEIVEQTDFTTTQKAIKNETEIRNTRDAHIRDGVAVTRFIYYLKHNIGKTEITEVSAAEVLEGYRRENEDFIELSFDTIAAYRENAAMMHYSATPESYSVLEPEGFLLVDSGGHYKGGTTDITRTIALGELTDREKEAYTLALKAHLRLLDAKFLKGATGQNLDVLARGIMWERGLDYRCGTGHGVGHILNVHEGPNGFRYKKDPFYPMVELLPGMITTDEPGLYYDGELGVRIESELLCVEDEKNEYGQFLCFENLTFAPFEPEAILVDMLDDHERDLVNEYHAACRDKLKPYLSKEEYEWLVEETKEL